MKIEAAMLRRIAVASDTDPRTVRRLLEGKSVRGLPTRRIQRVLSEEGLLDDAPSSIPRTDVLRLEENVCLLREALKTKRTMPEDRDCFGLLHTNLLALTWDLEKHFGFGPAQGRRGP